VAGVGGAGGAAGVGAAGGVAGVGAAGGSGGAAGTTNSCTRTEDRARIAVQLPGEPRRDCSSAMLDFEPRPPTALDGVITRIGPTEFEIDTCAPNADCVPSLALFEVEAPGLSLRQVLGEGAFVRVTYLIGRFFACQQSLEVSSIPTWGGVQNPASMMGDTLLLAVSDGGGTFDGSPYTVDRMALGCQPVTQGCGSVTPDEYALVLSPTAEPESAISVGMGQTMQLNNLQPLPSNWPSSWARFWTVRNLRSYQTEYCDDYWNFAWYLVWSPPAL